MFEKTPIDIYKKTLWHLEEVAEMVDMDVINVIEELVDECLEKYFADEIEDYKRTEEAKNDKNRLL